MTARPHPGRLAGGLLATLAVLALLPGSAAAAPKPFAVDVGARRDFVAQTNFVQCVGASIQMMLNMIEPGRDRTSATQRRLQSSARLYSGTRPDGMVRKGASVRGWAITLGLEGAGSYRLVGTDTLDEALLEAARAIGETGKPVGLLVWRGRHAWVMSGFEATGDPRTEADARVTGATIYDPLYPHGSTIWGPSPRPGQTLSPAEVGRQFVPRRPGPWSVPVVGGGASTFGGQYVLVLPSLREAVPAGTRQV
ncbi:MAG: hypothetical protein ACJ77N_16155 [Chloroflexota bacterium]